jgi:hypothetical protein
MEDVGICILWPLGLSYGHVVFLCPCGVFNGQLVYFSRFGMLYQEKSGNTEANTYINE